MKDSIANLRCVSCLFFVRSAAPLRLEVVSQLWRGALSPRTRALRNRCFRSDTSSSAAIVECWSALPGATHALRRVKLQSQTPPALSRSRALSSLGTLVRLPSHTVLFFLVRAARPTRPVTSFKSLLVSRQLIFQPRLGLRCFWRQRPRQRQRTRINAHSPWLPQCDTRAPYPNPLDAAQLDGSLSCVYAYSASYVAHYLAHGRPPCRLLLDLA
ncbi:hypothetical protein B0H14DRAFT_3652197 [Mycena olivaceomarginata]|nr:hypothetical protein B0H14DRAFT_3652197 [Mycena olivaceomarginata]